LCKAPIYLIPPLSPAADFYDSANTQGLVDGGLAGLFWSYIWSFIGMSLVMASLAEMASMSIRSICTSHIWFALSHPAGRLLVEGNIIGYLNLLRQNIRKS
jgi:hypothetical protein